MVNGRVKPVWAKMMASGLSISPSALMIRNIGTTRATPGTMREAR